jgi:hypothetical protein
MVESTSVALKVIFRTGDDLGSDSHTQWAWKQAHGLSPRPEPRQQESQFLMADQAID